MKNILLILIVFTFSASIHADDVPELNIIDFNGLGYHARDVVFTDDLKTECQNCVVIGMISFPVNGKEKQLVESKFVAIKCRNTVSQYAEQEKCSRSITSESDNY